MIIVEQVIPCKYNSLGAKTSFNRGDLSKCFSKFDLMD